eukprot:1057974-Rhodomonas_salina.6
MLSSNCVVPRLISGRQAANGCLRVTCVANSMGHSTGPSSSFRVCGLNDRYLITGGNAGDGNQLAGDQRARGLQHDPAAPHERRRRVWRRRLVGSQGRTRVGPRCSDCVPAFVSFWLQDHDAFFHAYALESARAGKRGTRAEKYGVFVYVDAHGRAAV